MQRTLPIALLSVLFLAACVDTTGIDPASSKTPNPKTSDNAAVTVVEYGDIQCPVCKAAHEQVNVPLIEKYGKQISFSFKQFPLRSLHRYAMDAALASECAADQGKFWDFLELAYAKQDDLSRSAITAWATQLGLDMDLFDRCFKSGIKEDAVLAEYDEGEKLGVTGTPTYFVNGEKVAASGLVAAVQNALANVGKNL